MREISERLIDLCHYIDNLVGKGNFIDSYFGNYTPNLINDGNVGIEWILFEINKLQKELAIIKASTQEAIDIQEFITSIEGYIKYAVSNESTKNYIKTLEKIYGISCYEIKEEDINNRISLLQKELETIGYLDSWPKSIKNWQNNNEIESKEYIKLLKKNVDIYREKVCAKVLPYLEIQSDDFCKLLTNINVKLTDTSEKWSAYNVYQGDFTSTVFVNKSGQFNRYFAPIFACHEVFPGHHFDLSFKEFLYKNSKLPLISTINLIYSPASIISEGIADYGRFFFDFPISNNEKVAFIYDRIKMDYRHSLAINLHLKKIQESEAIEKLTQTLGTDENESKRMINFAKDWKYYFPTYTQGYYLIKDIYLKHKEKCFSPLYMSQSLKSLNHKLNN